MLWHKKLGSRATYNELIRAFSSAGNEEYADNVKKIFQYHDSDGSDSSCSEDSFPLPQPETYPHPKLFPVELPSEVSSESCFLLDSSASKSLSEG